MPQHIHVIGAGLAGSEAAWQIARRGVKVHLYEMRPQKTTPAHTTGSFAELVCSNSLRSDFLINAAGLLKEEMRRLDSLIIKCAEKHRVPAGGALAVDREGYAAEVTKVLESEPFVEIHQEEITELRLNDGAPVVLATGPLTSDALAEKLRILTGEEYLYFFDAVAPIVTYESINRSRIFFSSRYDKGEPAYLNCPMTKKEYLDFWEALMAAERAPLRKFEMEKHFEGCLPVEVIAERGPNTLLFGPLKPVGLTDPNTGEQPYAVVQLRQDNQAGTLFNLVGFQTNLKWGEQEKVFRMIPGLESAEFVRYGVMHRNTYINAPLLLENTLMCRKKDALFIAGQLTGVEGYVESAASGILAGINAVRLLKGEKLAVMPEETALGALMHYIANAAADNFQPMNINFGLLPPLAKRIRSKQERNKAYAERALKALEDWQHKEGEPCTP